MMERRMIGELVQVPAGAIHVRQDGPADGKPIILRETPDQVATALRDFLTDPSRSRPAAS
ncbi:hypothetical protein ACIHDR_38060 [Nocardia sp. NPDC052278]|uniref:hypothetical protein n=1 Tax=unclassified Nocardia TaxID=2637762 RepID=UPI0036B0191F